ncbi:hypothetical protein GQ54DRAFT_314699, partial [Martensiomyces pterosporus]
EATSEDLVNRLVRDIMWATQSMLDSDEKSLGEVLGCPLPKNISTSDLAHQIAQAGKSAMTDEQKHDHWESLLQKIGGVGDTDTRPRAPETELLDSGRRKSVYQKGC